MPRCRETSNDNPMVSGEIYTTQLDRFKVLLICCTSGGEMFTGVIVFLDVPDIILELNVGASFIPGVLQRTTASS